MPHCAVIWCNNQSKNVNKQNFGVSYHRFPNDPYVKDKWILATGKYKWFPQKHDTVCSEHFENECFTKRTASSTRLSDDAIPTLNLHPILNEMKSAINNDDTDEAPANGRKMTKKVSQPVTEAFQHDKVNPQSSQSSTHTEPAGDPTPNIQDTPRTRKLKLSLMKSQIIMKKQRLEVKRFRESNRRLRKKVAKMEIIIKHLRVQPTLTDEEIISLERNQVKQFKTKVYTHHTCTPKIKIKIDKD